MKKRFNLLIGGIGVLVIVGAFYYFFGYTDSSSNQSTVLAPRVIQENGQTVKQFEITAESKKFKLKDDLEVDGWTFGGSVPGSQIRITEGDKVRITLKNNLSQPTSIHWHGLPVPNTMDGIPGVTQNAVKPGESFTYEFTVTTSGTYWYHSHQNSSEQIDKGLYGTLIVEPKIPTVKYDQDVTLVFDEWMGGMDHSQMNHGGNMSGMDHGQMSHDEMMKQMYNVFTVNGAAGKLIQPINVKSGEKVKLRLINAGYQTHKIHLQNQSFKITHTDGQPIQNPAGLTNQLVAIAPGERYDLEFTAGENGFWIDEHADSPAASDIKIPVRISGGKNSDQFAESNGQNLPLLDISTYGKRNSQNEQTYNLEYTMNLNNVQDQSGQTIYTINGKTFPNTQTISVKKGDWVKVKFVNEGNVDHPMHLHGHFFQVLTKNGQPIQGSPLIKDTLNIRPGEEYEVAFQADNEGDWMFHCHELHHASAGMVTELKYQEYKANFTPDPSAGNKPE